MSVTKAELLKMTPEERNEHGRKLASRFRVPMTMRNAAT
jgi:hypothetical protein